MIAIRLLVISDSHNRTDIIDTIISSQPDARHIFFLGDYVYDLDNFKILYSDRIFHIVSGNCDYKSFEPNVNIEIIKGKKILYTHGHIFSVKSGNARLKAVAKENKCDIVLYGHTHIPLIEYDDGVYMVNPGSCGYPSNGTPSYAVIDITESGIMPIIIELK